MRSLGILEHLVLKKMAGREASLKALYEWACGERPSEAAMRHGISKRSLFNLRSNLARKVGGVSVMEPLVVKTIPEIMSLPTYILFSNGVFICTICGKRKRSTKKRWPEIHLLRSHREEIEAEARRVASIMKKRNGLSSLRTAEVVVHDPQG